MKASILDPGRPSSLAPLTAARDLLDCFVANQPLRDLLAASLERAGFELVDEPAAADVIVRGDAWFSAETLEMLRREGSWFRLENAGGVTLAWSEGRHMGSAECRIIRASDRDLHLRFPWDLLRLNETLVGAVDASRIEGEVAREAVVEGFLHLGKGSVLLPGTFIEGPVIIGCNCRIGPNCYLRGNTSIGDGCRIGNAVEVKNSVISPGSAIGHLSYCGDSVIGVGVNFGAGTITANFRHDGGNHRSEVDGVLVDTGRRKFGSIIGDGVHTGIHTSIYPGRKLWPGVSTRPGAIVQRDLHAEGAGQ